MSRSKHQRGHREHEDMWSRRAGLGYASKVTWVKRLTHRIERQENKVRFRADGKQYQYETKEIKSITEDEHWCECEACGTRKIE